MKFLSRFHQQQRLKNTLTTLLLLSLFGMMGWLSTHYNSQWDMTQNASNTLSPVSQELLKSLPDPVSITAYIKKGQSLRVQIAQLVERYQQLKPTLSLQFIDPTSDPEKARDLDIGPEGLILLNYQGRTETLHFIDESTLTNALLQLAKANNHSVTFLTGHGEHAPTGTQNADFKQFSMALARRKIKTQTLNLSTQTTLPDNTGLLIIAAPKTPLLAEEIKLIQQYIEHGGNFLFLTDPDSSLVGIFKETLGITQLLGSIIDNQAPINGLKNERFIVTDVYPQHPITEGLKLMTLFPMTSALEIRGTSPFKAEALLNSSPKATLSTTTHETKRLSKAETTQTFTFAYALTHPLSDQHQQRGIIIGDSDFLTNAYINQVGNLDLGLRLLSWLVHEDNFIKIPAKNTVDKQLQFTDTQVSILSFLFLIFIPLILITSGLFIWQRRKRR